jgi:hypothetical protein
MESKFVRLIYDALQTQIKRFTHILRTSTVNHARHELDRTIINAELAKPLTELYKLFGVYAGKKTYREIVQSARVKEKEQKAGPGFGIDQKLLAAIIAFLKDHLLIKAVIPLTETLKSDILAMLVKGESEGWGVDKIAFELEQPGFSLWRARRIVRTESLFAMRTGRDAAKYEVPWETETMWIAANDHRTRHSHRDVDGKKVDEGKRFKVPIYKTKKGIDFIWGWDYMIGPGDPSASAGNVINCRCSDRTNAKRDANGRLVFKRKNPSVSIILPSERFSPHTVITI